MYPRLLANKLQIAATQYPVVAIVGPRQSGKTTLARALFKNKPYVSLETTDERRFASEDPRGFLAAYPEGAIIDEVQHVPDLFSYIQTSVDETKEVGRYILTGSQHFGLIATITQSLAGRVSLNKLLPLSWEEMRQAEIPPTDLNHLLFQGGYPRIYEHSLDPTDWLSNYVETYVERDVRSLKNIGDLTTFYRFLRMCAARSGQLINLSSLASDCGMTHNTAKAWLSLLEASFITYSLLPHYRNFNKRLIRTPKLHFYDTGLLCFLLGIRHARDLAHHAQRGNIFETFVISELVKARLNRGIPLNLFFWQDRSGHEIDCLIEQGETLIPVEVKAGQTLASDYFRNLDYWHRLTGDDAQPSYLVYAGDRSQVRNRSQVISWQDLERIPCA